MADVTSLCNQALAMVGTRSSISTISEESNEARACLLSFEPTRKQLLRAAHWGFARAYARFPLIRARFGTPEADPALGSPVNGWNSTYEPPPPWLYAYGIPADVLLVRYVLPNLANSQPAVPFTGADPKLFADTSSQGPMPKFEIASSTIPLNPAPKNVVLTNVSQAVMCYTKDITDTALFDESFSRAFVQALAAMTVTSLTGDLKMLDALTKLANTHILDARVKNANEGLNVMDHVPDWLSVRGVGPSMGTGPWIPEYGPLFGGSV